MSDRHLIIVLVIHCLVLLTLTVTAFCTGPHPTLMHPLMFAAVVWHCLLASYYIGVEYID